MLQFAQRYFKPYHNYLAVAFQIFICYFVCYLFKKILLAFGRKPYLMISNEVVVKQQQKSKYSKQQQKENAEQVENEKAQSKQKIEKPISQQIESAPSISSKELQKQQKSNKIQQQKEKNLRISSKVLHESYLSAIKGFSKTINDFSFNNHYICACSEDLSIKARCFKLNNSLSIPITPNIFSTIFLKMFQLLFVSARSQKKFILVRITKQIFYHLIYRSLIKNILPQTKQENKKPKRSQLPIYISQNSHYFISQGNHDRFLVTIGTETLVKIWSLGGELLKEFNTSYGQHYHSSWNILRNQLVISSWSTDSSIFECKTNKDHTFKTFEKVMLLRGDKGNVIDVNQDQTALRATLVSQEGVKIFTTDVEYNRQEDPHLLKTFKLADLNTISKKESFVAASSFFASKTRQLYVLSVGSTILLFDQEVKISQNMVSQFKMIEEIQNAANGFQIYRIVLNEFSRDNQKNLLAFIWSQEQEKINILNFSKYVYE